MRALSSHLSHSQVDQIATCSWRYYLERVLGAPTVPSWALIGGSVVHRVTEAVDHELLFSGTAYGTEQIEVICSQLFAEELADAQRKEPDTSKYAVAGGRGSRPFETEAWWRAAAPTMVETWQGWLEQSDMDIAVIDGKPAIELDFEHEMYGVVFKGGIDRILHNRRTGQHLIVDLKSGNKTPMSPLQLVHYRDALRHQYGVEVEWGAYFMTRSGELSTPVPLWRYPSMDLVVQNAERIRRENLFLPTIGPLCGYCDVSKFCEFQGGDPSPLFISEVS